MIINIIIMWACDIIIIIQNVESMCQFLQFSVNIFYLVSYNRLNNQYKILSFLGILIKIYPKF